jgi:hypothetical protein
MQEARKSSSQSAISGRPRRRIASIFLLAALFLGSPGRCGPYPIPGEDDDPDHCSGRKNQTVFYCVTPPAGAHCQEIMAESSPLYLGYRYECDSPPPSRDAGPAGRH